MQDGNTTAQTDVTAESSTAQQTSTSDNSESSDFIDGFFDETGKTDKQEEGTDKTTNDGGESNEEPDKSSEKTEVKKDFPKAEARKQELNEEIRAMNSDVRKLQAQRDSLKREISEYEGVRQTRQDIEANRVSADQLIEAGLDPQDARIEAMLINHDIDNQLSQLGEVEADIADLQYNLNVDRLELIRDFPVFDEKSADFDEEFTNQAIQMYEQAANLQLNEQGAPISADIKLYDYMANLANMRENLIKTGEQRGQLDKAKQSAAVFEVGGNAPVANDEDDQNSFINNFFKK